VGALWRIAAGVDVRHRLGIAPAPRHQHCWRDDGQPSPHAVYDSGDLPLYGPAATTIPAAQACARDSRRSSSHSGISSRPIADLTDWGNTQNLVKQGTLRAEESVYSWVSIKERFLGRRGDLRMTK